MTVRRIRQVGEQRGGMMGQWPNGAGWNDPAAIPPPGLGNMQRAGVAVTAHTALQVDTVFVALRVLSNLVIKMGNARAYTEELDADNVPYHSFEAEQPPVLTNTWGNLFQFDGTTRTITSMALFGEAFWYDVLEGAGGDAPALEVLHPAFVSWNKKTSSWDYGSGTSKQPLNPAYLTHIPFVTLPGAQRGLNSVEYAGVAYALALAAMEYGQRWFAQGAAPSFILSTDQKLGQEEVDRIAAKFLIEHSGLQSSHLPLVLDSGLEAKKVSSTPDEAQYLGTLSYARTAIGAWFGLPPHLIGAAVGGDSTWGKTVMEQGIQLVDFTLSGYVVRLEEAYGSLLPVMQKAKLNESAIVRSDGLVQAQRILALRTADVLTQDEIRVTELHVKPIGGGANSLGNPLASNAPAPGSAPPSSGATAPVAPAV